MSIPDKKGNDFYRSSNVYGSGESTEFSKTINSNYLRFINRPDKDFTIEREERDSCGRLIKEPVEKRTDTPTRISRARNQESYNICFSGENAKSLITYGDNINQTSNLSTPRRNSLDVNSTERVIRRHVSPPKRLEPSCLLLQKCGSDRNEFVSMGSKGKVINTRSSTYSLYGDEIEMENKNHIVTDKDNKFSKNELSSNRKVCRKFLHGPEDNFESFSIIPKDTENDSKNTTPHHRRIYKKNEILDQDLYYKHGLRPPYHTEDDAENSQNKLNSVNRENNTNIFHMQKRHFTPQRENSHILDFNPEALVQNEQKTKRRGKIDGKNVNFGSNIFDSSAPYASFAKGSIDSQKTKAQDIRTNLEINQTGSKKVFIIEPTVRVDNSFNNGKQENVQRSNASALDMAVNNNAANAACRNCTDIPHRKRSARSFCFKAYSTPF